MLILGVGRVGARALRLVGDELPSVQLIACDAAEEVGARRGAGIASLDPERILLRDHVDNVARQERLLREYLDANLPGASVVVLLCHELDAEDALVAATLSNHLRRNQHCFVLRLGPEQGRYLYTRLCNPLSMRAGSTAMLSPFLAVADTTAGEGGRPGSVEAWVGVYAAAATSLAGLIRGRLALDRFLETGFAVLPGDEGVAIVGVGETATAAASAVEVGLADSHARYLLLRAVRVQVTIQCVVQRDEPSIAQLVQELRRILPDDTDPVVHPVPLPAGKRAEIGGARIAVFAFRSPGRTGDADTGRVPFSAGTPRGGGGGEPAPAHPTPPDSARSGDRSSGRRKKRETN